ERARGIALADADSVQLTHIKRYKARLFQNKGQYDTAAYYAREAIAYYQRHGMKTNITEAYYGLARNYLLQDMDSLALRYFMLSYEQDTVNGRNNSALLQGLGGVYYKLNVYDAAERYYKRALEICEIEGLFDDRLSIYNTLSKIYNETGR